MQKAKNRRNKHETPHPTPKKYYKNRIKFFEGFIYLFI